MGADAQPLQLCSTQTEGSYVIRSQFNGMAVEFTVAYNGGQNFQVVSVRPRFAQGSIAGNYTRTHGGSSRGIASYAEQLDLATQ